LSKNGDAMEQDYKSLGKIGALAVVFLVIWVLLNFSFFLFALVWGFGKIQPFTDRHLILYLNLLSRISSTGLVFLNMPLIVSILLFFYAKEKKRDWRLFLIASILTAIALLDIAKFFDVYKMRQLVFRNGSSSANVVFSLVLSGMIFLGDVAGIYGILTKRKWVKTFLIIFFSICLVNAIRALLSILQISGISFKYPLFCVIYIFFYIFALHYFISSKDQR
jgi:hypothetical protein